MSSFELRCPHRDQSFLRPVPTALSNILCERLCLFIVLAAMTSYACRSVVGHSTNEDFYIISVCGNGQDVSYDLEVAHVASVVAVSPFV